MTVGHPEFFKYGTVGKPIPGVEVKIAEDGEILCRGHNVMKGYYKEPEATAEAIDKDGWFYSVHPEMFDEDGNMLHDELIYIRPTNPYWKFEDADEEED